MKTRRTKIFFSSFLALLIIVTGCSSKNTSPKPKAATRPKTVTQKIEVSAPTPCPLCEERIHDIVPGETLTKIAQSNFGLDKGPSWPLLAKRNGLKSPYTIYAGRKLVIPVFTPEAEEADTTLTAQESIMAPPAIYVDEVASAMSPGEERDIQVTITACYVKPPVSSTSMQTTTEPVFQTEAPVLTPNPLPPLPALETLTQNVLSGNQ